MNEQEALAKMVAPGQRRPNKKQMRDGIIQVMITRACDQACFHCTQGSNLGGKPVMMTPAQFEQACLSLKGYWGVIGAFGGNPAKSVYFEEICEIMRKHVPYEQRGLWCNNPMTPEKARIMRETFNPTVCNLNVHLDRQAWDLFRTYWPEARPFGLEADSRHSPCFVAMKDVIEDEGRRWELISDCDINKNWSALIGVFRGELRAWFCEIAGAQSMLHAHEPDYPDTGLDPTVDYDNGNREKVKWWKLPMTSFAAQVRKHCHECSVPLRGFGDLAMSADGHEQVSKTHESIFKPKVRNRKVELVTVESQLGERLRSTVDYLGNAKRPKAEVVQ